MRAHVSPSPIDITRSPVALATKDTHMSTATEWPQAEVLLSAEGHAHVIFEGVEADLSKSTPKEARAAVVTHLSHRARALGHPISTTITEPAGSWRIAVYPDGTIITEGALTPSTSSKSSRLSRPGTTRGTTRGTATPRMRTRPSLPTQQTQPTHPTQPAQPPQPAQPTR